MFEHVGSKNYRTYMQTVGRCLRPEGLFLLHTIGAPSQFLHSGDPWIEKYIFPGGQIPTRRQILRSSRGIFEVRDWHEFGQDYDPTLMAWHSRFIAAWDELRAEYEDKVGGRFRRMWEYYLLACAGAFRARSIELWQIVLSHPCRYLDYHPVR
jgi:cyclopropane-fatty-acyl-phospholipid synthase